MRLESFHKVRLPLLNIALGHPYRILGLLQPLSVATKHVNAGLLEVPRRNLLLEEL